MTTLYEIIKKFLYITAPFFMVVFLEMITVIPIRLPSFSMVSPPLALIPIYYWAVHNPWRFGIFSAFSCGFLMDVLTMNPLGINALIFTLLYYTVNQLRRFIAGKPFYVSWLGFSLFGTISLIIKWFLISLFSHNFGNFSVVLISAIFMIILYPLCALLCYSLIKISPEEDFE